jgi:hypothetical protein
MADPVFVDNVTPLDAVNMNKLQSRDEKGAVNGYPSLGADGKVPLGQLPPVGGADLSFDGDWVAGTYQDGDVVVYNGVAYLCVGGPTTAPPDPAIWGIAGAAAGVSYGTTLPVAPVDGQEAILVDNVANPSYQWRFRFNAGSSSPYKWEFIGGSDALVQVATDQTTATNNAWVNLATVGPDFIVPRAGDWAVFMQANAYGVATSMYIGVAVGDTTPVASTSFLASASLSASVPAGRGVLTGVAAASALRMRYFMVAAGTGHWSARMLFVRPVRVQ